MSQEERFNTRDRSYSAWHRGPSIRRYVSSEEAKSLAQIDLDVTMWVEYDDDTKAPIAFIETAIDTGQPFKPATVTQNTAKGYFPPVRAYVLLYKLAETQNPADPNWKDIKSFRVRRLWPEPEFDWRTLTPEEWAKELLEVRVWATKSRGFLKKLGCFPPSQNSNGK